MDMCGAIREHLEMHVEGVWGACGKDR